MSTEGAQLLQMKWPSGLWEQKDKPPLLPVTINFSVKSNGSLSIVETSNFSQAL